MATAKNFSGLELTLTMEEARDLEGLLVNAVSFDDNPTLHAVYSAISDETDTDIPDFEYDEDVGFFVKKEET